MRQDRAIRVFIAARRLVLRTALEMYLQLRTEFEVVGEADTAEQLLSEAQTCQPDVIVVDWGRFGGSFEETIAALHQLEPRPGIVLLTASPEAEQAARAAGADAIVSKREPPKALLTAIYRARLEGDE